MVGYAVLNGDHALLELKTHELSFDSGNCELLGLSFPDTGLLGPKVRRQWEVWEALRELLRIGHASSRDISVVVGHFTSLAMVRRELLSICEDMITVLVVKATCVSLWRVPKLQAVSARGFKTPDGQQ